MHLFIFRPLNNKIHKLVQPWFFVFCWNSESNLISFAARITHFLCMPTESTMFALCIYMFAMDKFIWFTFSWCIHLIINKWIESTKSVGWVVYKRTKTKTQKKKKELNENGQKMKVKAVIYIDCRHNGPTNYYYFIAFSSNFFFSLSSIAVLLFWKCS